ncbi:RCC1 domain-containing protein [Propionicicella superfundia]|uniref:RCC1 domain-containing protein n=1 Tax=Propionicicella superfundia TaxID=348582 RepID=UPI000420AD1C|nr:hypothetical protein [Propionicicella superfundia]
MRTVGNPLILAAAAFVMAPMLSVVAATASSAEPGAIEPQIRPGLVLASDGQVYRWLPQVTTVGGSDEPSCLPVAINNAQALGGRAITQLFDGGYVATSDGEVFSTDLDSSCSPRVEAVDMPEVMAGKEISHFRTEDGVTGRSNALTADGLFYSWTYLVSDAVLVNDLGALKGKKIGRIEEVYDDLGLALTTDGELVRWQFSLESTSPDVEAVDAFAGAKIERIDMGGGDQPYAITSDGRLFALVQTDDPKAGYFESRVWKEISGALDGKKVVSVSAAEAAAYALTSDGMVFDLHADPAQPHYWEDGAWIPTAVGGALEGRRIVGVEVSGGSRYAIAADGTVYAWGLNEFGQLGDGTRTDSDTPVAVKTEGTPLSGKKVVRVVAADGQSDANAYALASDGSAYAWGSNGNGELGDGTKQSSSVPVQVKIGADGSDSASPAGDGSSASTGDGGLSFPVIVAIVGGGVAVLAGAACVVVLRLRGRARRR